MLREQSTTELVLELGRRGRRWRYSAAVMFVLLVAGIYVTVSLLAGDGEAAEGYANCIANGVKPAVCDGLYFPD